jgi:hypothetical protein
MLSAFLLALGEWAIRWVRDGKHSTSFLAHGVFGFSCSDIYSHMAVGRDGNRSNSHEIGFRYHILPHFYSNTNSNVLKYKYKYKCKTDFSNSIHIRISTWFGRQHLPILFIGNLQIQNQVKTKVLVHNRDCSLRISHSFIHIYFNN